MTMEEQSENTRDIQGHNSKKYVSESKIDSGTRVVKRVAPSNYRHYYQTSEKEQWCTGGKKHDEQQTPVGHAHSLLFFASKQPDSSYKNLSGCQTVKLRAE